ncbi:MAG: glycosyltransferase [Chloroflexi bacterium]|nr:glycosyltransferase [Chloroflexota bacterium]
MRLLKLTTVYPTYANAFYARQPGLAVESYAVQLAALMQDAAGGADFWTHALGSLGYEATDITINLEPLQQAWAREHDLPPTEHFDATAIALAQISAFQPDVLWYDHPDEVLLAQIRALPHAPRLVLGWVGSAIPRNRTWRQIDLMLSCAPESVAYFHKVGLPAAHLDHGFDPRINAALQARPATIDLSFIGSIIRSQDFHLQREQILVRLVEAMDITIYSASANYRWPDQAKALARAGLQSGVRSVQKLGWFNSLLMRQPLLKRMMQGTVAPVRLVNPRLKSVLRPPVFGLDMFQILHDSKINLNIHADSSPLYASNMRLFEATGVGVCLLTDWRQNLGELFDVEREVVAYRSPEECVEKARWLLDHPAERVKIAQAGQQRVLRDHTYQVRAAHLDEIIQAALK